MARWNGWDESEVLSASMYDDDWEGH